MRNVKTVLNAIAIIVFLTSCGADKAMKRGDKFFALGEYYDAATQYKKAYTKTSPKERETRGIRALKLAECYRRINYSQRAVAAYNNAIRYGCVDSVTYLRLAQQLMRNANYKDAAYYFQLQIDSVAESKMARIGLTSAQLAPQWKAQGSDYTVKREDFFNSRRADYSPMLLGDNSDQLYFTSTRNDAKGDEYSSITGMKNGDIFLSEKDENGKWQKPEAINSELNSEDDEGICAFSLDGLTMYLTQCTTDDEYPRYATICTSARSDATWGVATELTISRDTLSSYAHPAISPDGNWLYFVSDMPGGVGGLDIWRVSITTNGLGAVENLEEPINTEGDEMFPAFRPNGDFYFSSDGHPGMGGLDIFIARMDSTKKEWSIEHPGFPLNSQGDDFGMTFEGLHNKGFFSSNRGDGKGWDHIYSFENPEIVQTVKGWVYEQDGYELTAATVYMVGNDGTYLKLGVRGDGSFVQQVKPDVDYVFLGTCRGHLNHREDLHVEQATESEEYVLQFPLASIGVPVLIENIFYDFDKATLRPESEQALDELVKLLEENPNITIELSSHCDYRGSDAYNHFLSQRRAESVVNYLIEHGIENERLSPVGYGEEKPKIIKKKLTETYTFLKEGDVLTEEFIKQLDDEEKQEICNQLNRRTEFLVLRTTYGMFDAEGKLIITPKTESKQEEIEVEEDDDWLF